MTSIRSLHVYPIKSCGGLALQELSVDGFGPVNDRLWVIVDESNKFLTQRTHPELARIRLQAIQDKFQVQCGSRNFELDSKKTSGQKKCNVTIWKDQVDGVEESAEIHQILSDFLQIPVRLVRFSAGSERWASSKGHQLHFQTRFTDSMPLLVVNLTSLGELNKHLSDPIPINRFRANVVLESPKAFQEDIPSPLEFPQANLNYVKSCGRCRVICTDQEKGLYLGSEVLERLKRIHSLEGVLSFGSYYWAAKGSLLRINDQIQQKSSNF